MKRSLLTVGYVVLAGCLAVTAVGCANDVDENDVATVGQTRQDLSLGETTPLAADAAQLTDTGRLADTEGDEGPGGGRPQPEPWGGPPVTTGGTPGTNPSPESDPRRITTDSAVAGSGDRPQPEPWHGSAKNASLTQNQ